jgi:hypothetical protein
MAKAPNANPGISFNSSRRLIPLNLLLWIWAAIKVLLSLQFATMRFAIQKKALSTQPLLKV